MRGFFWALYLFSTLFSLLYFHPKNKNSKLHGKYPKEANIRSYQTIENGKEISLMNKIGSMNIDTVQVLHSDLSKF